MDRIPDLPGEEWRPIGRNKVPAERFDLPDRVFCFCRLPIAEVDKR